MKRQLQSGAIPPDRSFPSDRSPNANSNSMLEITASTMLDGYGHLLPGLVNGTAEKLDKIVFVYFVRNLLAKPAFGESTFIKNPLRCSILRGLQYGSGGGIFRSLMPNFTVVSLLNLAGSRSA